MYLRMNKAQRWHEVFRQHGIYVKTNCGTDYDITMCETRETEEECDGAICKACQKSVQTKP